MSMDDYFYNGELMKCYELAKQVTNEEDKVLAQKYIRLLEEYEFDCYPMPTGHLEVQHVERADESYPESDLVADIRAIKDEESFAKRIQQLEEVAKTGTPADKAQSFFTQGELFLFAHHYNESVHCFQQAVKENPNKAVYWGITGQTMHRFGWMPFDALGYLEQAIQLDPTNPRWKWNKALVLIQLAKDLQMAPFMANAAITLEDALASCGEQQRSLKEAIQNTVDNMDSYVFS
ncbi:MULTISPECIES: tetratricopeptide repeat protein [Lysinibacillus]|uniref:tetratricopeptide repeat protein n=1 Tax=Lysinibacillus TaxID=400634 RepID=UPI0021A35F44|nr:O-linked GlcNAc transferase [Lysinibacillus capsici]MCT1537833.1 O-linked GlcNAc transferase [Lysinibacillus capsici]MCT1571719.1 O-linked GlcNAc transferase [Lysinibacillus capsici]MCT1649124.1 O-linked GlcNAc transferase [Lysinibacillus capsici]MCT1724835.1 O-linked GlcNAc transferase [Lysinibacillus capsici]MCT1785041.1 O-linked GlcNAc transferase [Lysinibacillus capsici]